MAAAAGRFARRAFSTPAANNADIYDVVIVGGGMVGSALAALLSE
jgi:glycerol-3-phosphate dehydrogenase